MRTKQCLSIFSILLVLSCADNLEIPMMMGDYTVYEVDIKELSGLCLSQDRSSLIACGDQGVVRSISFDGQTEEIWTYASDMEGISVNPSNGDYYLAIEGEQEVHVLSSPAYDEQTVLFTVQDASGYKNNGLEAVEYYKDDIVFVGSQQGANLWQYRLDGTMISKISLSAFASEIAGLCYDVEADCLWVTDSKKAQMFTCTVDGELISTYDLSFVDNAESICVDRANDCVWVGSDEDNTKLYKIDIDFNK